MGNVVLFEIGVKGHRVLGTQELRKYGQVTSVALARDSRYLVVGYEAGVVVLWGLYYFDLLKQELPSTAKVMQVLFCSENSETFISNDI